MTKVLIHELPEQAKLLMARLRSVLEAVSTTIAAEMLERANIDQREKPRVVLTGQYSSGKSSLIKALTDANVDPVIDADIATDAVTEYPWDGAVVLVDTPGVQSGLRSHDELALGAIGKADFVLFVITVALFDDASRDYLRHLANTLQMFGQMVVVITQTSKQSAAEGVRAKAVQQALGTVAYNLPIAEVDSVYYLRSLEGGERAELLRARSGIDRLRSTINQISHDNGQLAILRQPLHLIRQLSDEAQQFFVADDRSRAAIAVLAQQRAAVSQRRHMIEKDFAIAESTFKSQCLVDVRGFVDAATSLPADEVEGKATLERAEARLVDALDQHAEQFAASINTLSDAQFDILAEQLAEIGESNRARLVARLSTHVNLEGPDGVDSRSGSQSTPGGSGSSVDWNKVSTLLKKGQGWWGAGGGLKDSSGSIGHQITKDVGHFFGKKFQPWEAIKIADKVGKAVKWGGVFVQVAASGYEVWRDERETRKELRESERQHSAFVTEIMGHADRIASDARKKLHSIIDPPLEEFLAQIDAAQAEILGADQVRNAASAELKAIAAEADRLLVHSATQPAPGELEYGSNDH